MWPAPSARAAATQGDGPPTLRIGATLREGDTPGLRMFRNARKWVG